jgi:hypothetical protein
MLQFDDASGSAIHRVLARKLFSQIGALVPTGFATTHQSKNMIVS